VAILGAIGAGFLEVLRGTWTGVARLSAVEVGLQEVKQELKQDFKELRGDFKELSSKLDAVLLGVAELRSLPSRVQTIESALIVQGLAALRHGSTGAGPSAVPGPAAPEPGPAAPEP
jgi:hypothetical protein